MPERDAAGGEAAKPDVTWPDTATHGAAEPDAPGQSAAGPDAPGQSAAGPDAAASGPERGRSGSGTGAERARMESEFLLAMRRTGSTLQLLGQVAAERIGVNATDLNCLNLVALAGRREPMTAGELARQTGLTTASITGVLDRLEEGGFVRRERDPKDRRRVNVNLNPGPALAEIGPTFGPLVMAWRSAAASYSDSELRLLLEFQRRFLDIVRDSLDRLRGET
jgi:DNA-binding transcriptional ArsR family regulator